MLVVRHRSDGRVSAAPQAASAPRPPRARASGTRSSSPRSRPRSARRSAPGWARRRRRRRLAEHGPNELQAAQGDSPWRLLLDQFKNVLILILLVAVALSALLGHATEADRHRA